MITPQQQEWLIAVHEAAAKAGHIWPAMAACEAALESSWGTSELCREAHNLFGTKQHSHPVHGTLSLPTREYLDHAWVTVEAAWVNYPDLATCFADRMATLKALAPHYPHYAAALAAKTETEYIFQVSLSWSTDPHRAVIVQSIYHAHAASLESQTV